MVDEMEIKVIGDFVTIHTLQPVPVEHLFRTVVGLRKCLNENSLCNVGPVYLEPAPEEECAT